MSTRTRIVLLVNGKHYAHGAQVFRVMTSEVFRKRFKDATIAQYTRMSKQEKILFLARHLRPGLAVVLFQEPRHTRRSKSLYWRMIKNTKA